MELAEKIITKFIPEKYKYSKSLSKFTKRRLLKRFNKRILDVSDELLIIPSEEFKGAVKCLEDIQFLHRSGFGYALVGDELLNFQKEIRKVISGLNYKKVLVEFSITEKFWGEISEKYNPKKRKIISDNLNLISRLNLLLKRHCMHCGAVHFYSTEIVADSYAGDTLKKFYNMLISND